MRLSRLVSSIPGSATLGLAAKARELAARGVDVVSMAVGEPDFNAPAVARAAAHAAIDSGKVRYTPAEGLLSLRKTLAAELERTRGVSYDPTSEIVVCHSCKHALAQVLQALLDPGDEVLLLAPAWNSYDAQVALYGARPVTIAARPDMGPDLEAIAAAITPATRGILLNNPSNPSGYVWSRAELEAVVRIAEAAECWILSDEIYRRLVYDDAEAHSPVSCDYRERTVIVDGASKAYAMTGYRMGFVAAPALITRAVADVQSQTTGCPNYISQMAYEAALAEEPPELSDMRAEFDARRRRLIRGLAELELPTPTPAGAFYAFPNVSAHCDERGVDGFCADLLEAEAVVLVPGTVFGTPDHVRLSYALDIERLEEALARLGRFLARS